MASNSIRWQMRLVRCFALLVAFAGLGTIASSLLHIDPGPIKPVSAILIVLIGSSVSWIAIRDWMSVLAILAGSATAEILGLFTGFPFGVYEYTNQWIPTVPLGIHRFPLLVPFSWLMVVGGCFAFCQRLSKRWQRVLGAGLLAALIDLPMEKAMTDVFGYWKWQSTGPFFGAPVLNFCGWFGVAALLSWVLDVRLLVKMGRTPILVLAGFIFFVAWCGIVQESALAWLVLALLGSSLLWFSKPSEKSR